MKTKIFTLLLVLMVCAFAVTAVAVPPSTVKVNGLVESENLQTGMYLCKGGTDDWKQTLTLKTDEMTQPVDFYAVLNTSPIKRAIIEWYEYGLSLIETLAGDNVTIKNNLMQHFNEWPVTGEFVVTIRYPEQLTVPAEHLVTGDLVGFNPEVDDLFEETSRTVATADGITTVTITIAIKDADNDGTPGIMEQALYDGVMNGTYLNNLNYSVDGVVPNAFTTALTINGEMHGYTAFQMGKTYDPASDRVFFDTDVFRTTLRKYVPGGSQSEPEEYKITFNIDGNTDEVDPMYARGNVKESSLPKPTKPGYTLQGWFYDSALTKPVKDSLNVYSDITLYGHWVSDTLLTDDHFAYIIGYPDETVRPLRNITREEATMIFYRLLRDDIRDGFFTLENNFSDIAPERWSNSAISTMANGGFVVGRPDGTFDPEAPITRAEFATMAVRFASLMDTAGVSFSDIAGHWAETYILKAAVATWVTGYPDGTFKPDSYITRAEAMTLVNNVLMRHVNETGLHADTRKWIDMDGTEWYYYIVLEATNSHDFTRQVDGYNEVWTAILPNKTWK